MKESFVSRRLLSIIPSAVLSAALLICLFLFIVLFSRADATPTSPKKQIPVTIEANQIRNFAILNPARSRFGALEFRGGLILKSGYRYFGGISAMLIRPNGENFIALSDRALWLQGSIVYEGTRPVGIRNAVVAPVLNAKGRVKQWDTESFAENGGTIYVGIESKESLLRFDFGRYNISARGRPVPVPEAIAKLPSNKGLEAIVFVPRQYHLGRTLIAFSERGLDSAGNIKAFLVGGPTPGSFTVKRTDEYDISDAALLPDGDVLILERKLSLLEGFSMRLRKIALSSIRPGAIADGTVLIEADARTQIDNMEALSVHRSRSGEVILTLMSDNNFSPLQRTVLLQFRLP